MTRRRASRLWPLSTPVVGTIELSGEALELPGDAGPAIITYTVEPAKPSAEALQFLSNWATEHAAVDSPSWVPASPIRLPAAMSVASPTLRAWKYGTT
jgi:hypothetical protein